MRVIVKTRAYDISRKDQVRALASPVRQEIVDALDALGPSTIAALAVRLGKRPDALYFHVKALHRVGLLILAGTVGEGRREAAVYDLPGRPLRINYTMSRGKQGRDLAGVFDGLLRLARRDAKKALVRADSVTQGPSRDLWVARFRGWLGPVELKRLNILLLEAVAVVRKAKPRKSARPVALAFALTPVGSGRGEKKAHDSADLIVGVGRGKKSSKKRSGRSQRSAYSHGDHS